MMADTTVEGRAYRTPYSYKTLQKGEIRLLALSHGTYDQRLEGKLQIFKIDKAPDYTAVSYCWGPPVFSHTLYIGDRGALLITETLFGALRRFRDDLVIAKVSGKALTVSSEKPFIRTSIRPQYRILLHYRPSLRTCIGELT